MAAKSQSESPPRGGRQSQRREILGILSMAFALFALLSLVSLHFGTNRLMGPGGAATAAGLYSLAGLGAYLVIAGLVVASVRCFRARPLCAGVVEAGAVLMLLAAVAVLLHLPFAGRATTLNGPGGLLGQWLGEISASFIGVVGAALAGATMLFVSLLLLSAIRLHEVATILGWAFRQTGHALWTGLCAVGRVARAMFPEKDDHADADADADGEGGTNRSCWATSARVSGRWWPTAGRARSRFATKTSAPSGVSTWGSTRAPRLSIDTRTRAVRVRRAACWRATRTTS